MAKIEEGGRQTTRNKTTSKSARKASPRTPPEPMAISAWTTASVPMNDPNSVF